MTLTTTKGFYVGDPCYVLPEEIYDEVWGRKYDYEDGIYLEGFAVKGTLRGDGCYPFLFDLNEFPDDCLTFRKAAIEGICVDSGTIAIIDLALLDEYHLQQAKEYGIVWELPDSQIAEALFEENDFKHDSMMDQGTLKVKMYLQDSDTMCSVYVNTSKDLCEEEDVW